MYTEFTVRSGGSNLYAGTLDGSAEASTTPLITYTNGNWTSGTGVFVVASGNPVTAGVAVGNFASVYNDGASAPAVFVGRITAVTSTQITVSTTAKSGTAPTTSATARTLVVGGAWSGPSGASGFPFSFVTNTLTDSSSHPARVNYKNDQTYSISTAIAAFPSGGITHQGYSSTFGDGGRATIDGSTNAISLITAQAQIYHSLILTSSATTGTNTGISSNAATAHCINCVVAGTRGTGFSGVNTVECEAYNCNISNTAASGGFGGGNSGIVYHTRSISHDNAGANSAGFTAGNGIGMVLIDCIADTNGGIGFAVNTGGGRIINCDAYNNGSDGLNAPSTAIPLYIENCNFIKNGGYGVNSSGMTTVVRNCGYGSGTQTNTSGTTNGASVQESGAVTYASNVTPWADPANGDFRVILAAAQSAGRGNFTETAASYAGTTAYPDIGASQHADRRDFFWSCS